MESANSVHEKHHLRDFKALHLRAKQLRRKGYSKTEIAKVLAVSRITICRWLPPRGTHRRRTAPRSKGRPPIITHDLLIYLEQMRQNDPDTIRETWDEIPADWVISTVKRYCHKKISRESVRRIRLHFQHRNPEKSASAFSELRESPM